MQTCFVIMPFREPFNRYYDRIVAPTVQAAGLMPRRGDSLFRPSPIMEDVWQLIRDAEIIIAELTTQNANVFYELGLAHAVGKPVILLSETTDDVPFDLRSLRVITYDRHDPEWGDELRRTLERSIQETLAAPMGAVAPLFHPAGAPAQAAVVDRLTELELQVSRLVEEQELHHAVDQAGPADRPGLVNKLREMEKPEPTAGLSRQVVIEGKGAMTGARLRRADLSGADLSLSNFISADLREVDFSEANLNFGSFNGADLSGADLSGADIGRTNFSNANLVSANLKGVTNWKDIRAMEDANVAHVRNAPSGFRQWALSMGAVERARA
jgi:hypothetical protein